MSRFVLFLLSLLLSSQGLAGSLKPSILRYQPFPKVSGYTHLEEEKESIWKRLSFGGNIGLQFGNPTNIILSPAVGYTPPASFFQNRLMVGMGLTYMYFRSRYYGVKYESNIYGGRIFTRFLVTNALFAYVEYELLNSPPYQATYDSPSDRVWANSFFVGGGYLIRISEKGGGVMITALYSLAWTPQHPVYSSPWNIRVGFML